MCNKDESNQSVYIKTNKQTKHKNAKAVNKSSQNEKEHL